MPSEHGPFVVVEQSAADGTYWTAVDLASGIGVIGHGRDSRSLAQADADALNAAWRLGRNVGRARVDALREINQ